MDGKQFNAKMAQDELAESLSEEKPFLIPSNFLFLAKSLTTIDGICQQLDPDFNFITYIESMMEDTMVMPSIDVNEITRTSFEMPVRVRSINEAVNNLDKSRSSMKRSIEKTRKELKTVQYSLMMVLISQNYNDNQMVFWGSIISCIFFILRQ